MTSTRGKRQGSLFQRKSGPKKGEWVATVELPPDASGHRRRKSFAGMDKEEVELALNRALNDLAAGKNIDPETTTVGAFLEEWLASLGTRLRPSTLATYTTQTRNHLIHGLGRRRLHELTARQVQTFIAGLITRSERPLSPRTATDIHNLLIIALNQAIEWELLTRNVAAIATKPRVPKKEQNHLTPAEARLLLKSVQGEPLEALFVVSLSLGLRRGEALGLRWEDVDLARSRLAVRQSLQRIGGELRIVEPKTTAAYRSIHMPAMTMQALKEHQARQEQQRQTAGETWRGTGLVFCTRLGTPIEPRNYKRSLDRVLARAGIDHVRIHDLRHTAASLLLSQDIPIKQVAEIMGHSSVSVTLDLYGHLYDAGREDAANKMNSILLGGE